ncbi:hypothetical protein LSH36_341g03025 [Paralvinella palmiformis]|uniref:Sjoegren syndrome/scleroderma autoantigen 1 n=1 Tax=Paralvinella palmiformis TaxID=53620 RepID=A0AAD9JH17_9ANNE|nr:hypothetical protein LSH36_341g03025 [Paralvinella palmiformis]
MSSEADIEQVGGDWQPPTEAEMKVLQARRERSDKISKLMGDYLLKGYRMLGVCCSHCDTILLQDKRGTNYCVACQELDADNVKDDPALSDQAALSQAAEHSQRMSGSSVKHNRSLDSSIDNIVRRDEGEISALDSATGDGTTRQRSPRVDFCPPDLTRDTPRSSASAWCNIPAQESCAVRPKVVTSQASQSHVTWPAHDRHVTSHTLTVLYQKLQTASDQLRESDNVNSSIALCQLIKQCAEAIEVLHKLQHQN